MKRFFTFEKIQDKGFQDFLRHEKFSFANFFFIYLGALLTCFLLGAYLQVLRFSPFLAAGNLLLLWAGWLVISYLLARQERFERLVLWTNNLWLVFLFFHLVFLSPSSWVVILLPYLIFSLLLINFMQGNFLPIIDPLSLGFLGVAALLFFYLRHRFLFQADASAQLVFLFLVILILSSTAFFLWNGVRIRKSLQKIYHQRRELEETAAVLEIRIKAKTRELQEQAELLREENRLKTEALRRRIDELERFRRIVVGREMKMVELKEQVVQLEKELDELKGAGHEE